MRRSYIGGKGVERSGCAPVTVIPSTSTIVSKGEEFKGCKGEHCSGVFQGAVL